MASTLRERRKALLRDEILSATQQLMAERGYAAMSMEDLAAKVGVSKPTLYSQFPAKEDLVVALALQIMERVFVLVEAEGESSPLERLLRFLHASARLQVSYGASAMQLWMPEILEILGRHPESRAYMARIDERLVATIRAAIAAGEIDPALDVASVVRIFNALNISSCISRFTACGDLDPDRHADAVVAVFKRGVAPQPAA